MYGEYVFKVLLKLFSTLNKKVILPAPRTQFLAIITFEITPLMEENYPSGPENIQFSQRAEQVNAIRSGKVIFRKFGNEAQSTRPNFEWERRGFYH